MNVNAFAAEETGGELKPFQYQLDTLARDEVDIQVSYCGICHSDLSMLNNDWRMTAYPFVPGHEVVGKIIAKGEQVNHLNIGDTVGLGWYSRSCMVCDLCMHGQHNLCKSTRSTIVGRFGGFADKVRAQAAWVSRLPEGMEVASAGPLFCGGITVFNPIVQYTTPLHHVGVVGIGGLGHLALAFLKAWGCEVTAFSTSPDKEQEARNLGAHHFVSTHDKQVLAQLKNRFDMILVTANVELDWDAYVSCLKPMGRLHLVGAAPSVSAKVFQLMAGQKSISSSPLGSPGTVADMLRFAKRHNIKPITETFALADVNEAMEKLRSGKPRYRLVLEMT